MFMLEKRVWVNHGLPFRPCQDVYGCWPYAELPAVKPLDSLAPLSDLVAGYSPPTFMRTADSANLPGMLFVDHTVDNFWALDMDGSVCLLNQGVVATSVGEFVARLKMEASIWWSVIDNSDELTYRQMRAQEDCPPTTLWESVRRYMSSEQLDYLRPYCEAAKKGARHCPVQ